MLPKAILNLIDQYMDKVYIYNNKKLYTFNGSQWKFICDIPFQVEKMIYVCNCLYFSIGKYGLKQFKLLSLENDLIRDVCIPDMNYKKWRNPLYLLKEIDDNLHDSHDDPNCNHVNEDDDYCDCNFLINYQEYTSETPIKNKKTSYCILANGQLYKHEFFFKVYDGCNWEFLCQKCRPTIGQDLLFYAGFIYSFSDTVIEKYEIKKDRWSIIRETEYTEKLCRVVLVNDLFYLIYQHCNIEIYNPVSCLWDKYSTNEIPFIPNEIVAVSKFFVNFTSFE